MRLVERLKGKCLRLLANNSFYRVKIDASIHLVDLFFTFIKLFVGYVRGLLKARRWVVLGAHVDITCSRMLAVGKAVRIGGYTQLNCWGQSGLNIGDRSSIGRFSLLSVSGSLANPGKGIDIGENVGIGDFAHIGGSGGVRIGDDTITGAYLSIHPENHNFADSGLPIRLQGISRMGITIGSGCWIGAKVTILDGAVLGDGCVVAAGAVVRGCFPDNSVIAGVPARVIRRRDGEFVSSRMGKDAQ